MTKKSIDNIYKMKNGKKLLRETYKTSKWKLMNIDFIII